MSFNTAKIINVYYKADRKPYDANGKPISYFGEDFNGANEATEIRFYMPEGVDLGAVDCVAEVKRANGDKRFDLLTKITNGDETYYRLVTNAWYNQYVGKVTIAFKAYFGGVTIVDGVITATSGAIYVSDIFHLQIAYAPSSTEPVPPFDPSDVTTFINALSAKLNVNNGIFVIASALPSLANDVYDGQWFLVKNNIDGEQGRLYYIDGSTAIAVELELGKLKLTPTGNGDLTANTAKLNWEQTNGTIQMGLYNDVNVGLGEDVFYYAKASANITKGQAIQFAGYQGDHLLIKPAVPSEINANPKLIMGIAKHNITSGDFGYVLHFGKLDGVDTGSFVAGNFLWFASEGSTPGALTNTQPLAPSAKVLMAAVIKQETASPANNGVIQVRITIEPRLTELQDVEITNIQNNDVLKFNATTQQWENTNAFVLVDEELTLIETRLDTAESDIDNIESAISNVDNTADLDKPISTATQSALDLKADLSYVDGELALKANASDVTTALATKADLVDGKVPSSQLPSFVDDVEEYANLASFPATGEAGKIYVALDTDKTYRWGGSVYVVISDTLALGETSSTAYRGDRGKTAYDHSQAVGNPHETTIDDIGGGNITGYLNVSGTLGVGTTSPNQPLTVQANSSALGINIIGRATGNLGYLSFSNNDNNALQSVIGNANANLTFDTDGAERMRITNAGNVGIGTTSPASYTNIVTLTIGDNSASKIGLLKFKSTYNSGDGAEIWQDTSGNLTFYTNSTSEKMRITSAGNVGIGTTSPASLLSVGSETTGVASPTAIELDRSYRSTVGDNMALKFYLFRNTSNSESYGFGLNNDAGLEYHAGLVGGSSSNTNHSFYTHNVERMRITGDGNVGIGLTSPQQKLGIDGGIGIGANSKIGSGNGYSGNSSGGFAGFAELEMYSGSTGNTTLHNFAHSINLQTASSTRLHITNGGNVGIGTTTPDKTLTVNGDGRLVGVGSGLYFDTTGADNSAWLKTSADFNLELKNNRGEQNSVLITNNNIELKIGATPKLLINPSGNVGIGTTSPFALSNYTTLALSGVTGSMLDIMSGSTTTSRMVGNASVLELGTKSNIPFHLYTNDNYRMTITGDGNVGIGTTSPAEKLDVNGWVRSANGTFDGGGFLIPSNANASSREWAISTEKYVLGDFAILQSTAQNTSAKSGTTRLYINPSGNVGIGQTSPAAALHAQHNNADTTPAIIANLNNSSSTGNILVLQKAGSAVASFSNSGIFVGQSRPANDSKTANHTLTFVDEGRVLRINSSSDLTVTIPLNSGTELPVGFEVALIRYGTGAVTISPTSGVTLNSKNSERKISGQYGSVALKKISTDEWVLVGSLEA